MATSPAHRFGQIIGDVLEDAIIGFMCPIAEDYSLYLDYRHPRAARGGQKEVRWSDINGNMHKLDIVMEKNGSEMRYGEPPAFIEIAWRRYTKHSKNKAQEISGAIRPLISKYSSFTPFFGAVVAGIFTQNSINQMVSEGFEVVYIPIHVIESAFSSVGIDAHWEEDTPESELQRKVQAYESLTEKEIGQLKAELLRLNSMQLGEFQSKLRASLGREIHTIRIMTFLGNEGMFTTPEEACRYIVGFDSDSATLDLLKIEIYVRYTNGDKLEAQYRDRQTAIAFLQSLR